MSIILSLISIHSFIVGIGLIFFSGNLIEYLGFQFVNERFFQVQGGVFHVIMSICYLLPVLEYKKYESLIIFSIIIKLCATTFLMIYFLFVDSILLILLSGIGDGAMAIALIFAYRSNKYRNPEK
ncbi:MAG: hypothetical protein HOB05_12105 [Bacteroidetes bacterium]|nr:hypothetical protein [Bacteroidota bacterium]